MGRPALALGMNFLLDKPLVNRLFTGAASIEDFLRILDDACFGAGARGPGSLGLAPVVATAPFSTYKSPKFYLSFTILVSFILVKYPDRIGLVNTVR